MLHAVGPRGRAGLVQAIGTRVAGQLASALGR